MAGSNPAPAPTQLARNESPGGDSGRLAALEAWAAHADRSIEGLDRKMDHGFRDIGDRLDRIQRDVNDSRRFPVGAVLTAVIGFTAILLTIIGLWMEGYTGEQARQEQEIRRLGDLQSAHNQEPGHDVAMILHAQTTARLTELETVHQRELARLDARVTNIESSRFSNADGAALRAALARIAERVAVLDYALVGGKP